MCSNADSLYFLLVFIASLRLLAVEHGLVASLSLWSVVSKVFSASLKEVSAQFHIISFASRKNLTIAKKFCRVYFSPSRLCLLFDLNIHSSLDISEEQSSPSSLSPPGPLKPPKPPGRTRHHPRRRQEQESSDGSGFSKKRNVSSFFPSSPSAIGSGGPPFM